MTDKDFEKYLELNEIKTLSDLITHESNIAEDHIISTLKICDYDPFEFFKNCTVKQKSEWFEKIDQINLADVITSKDYSNSEKNKLKKWLSKYITYRTEAIRSNNKIQYYTTVQEQLYILNVLRVCEVFLPRRISQDESKQSEILSLLMNRASTKFHNNMRIFRPSEPNISLKSLENFKQAFEKINMLKAVDKIQEDINKILKK